MKTVLVVDADRTFLDGLAATLSRFKKEFELRTAENGEQALSILQTDSIHLLVTALDLPVMDGFELVAFVLQNYPSVDVIVMGTPESGRIGPTLTAEGAFHYLLKPVAAQTLLDHIREIFAQRAKGYLRGLSLSGFLQLLNSERRTCTLAVRSDGETGRVDLFEGEVIDAILGENVGRSALFELLSWEHPEIDLEAYRLASRRTIEAPLARLLLEAAFGSDGFRASDSVLFPQTEVEEDEQRKTVAETLAPDPTMADQAGEGSQAAEPTSDDQPDPLTAQELIEVRQGLAEALALPGALGAALIDMSKPACLASSSHSSDTAFGEAARRAGEVALARLNAMAQGPARMLVRQLKLHRAEQYGLVRFVRSRPHLLLYFAGERGRVDPDEASRKLAELEGLIGS